MSDYTEHVSIEPFRDGVAWNWRLTAPLNWEIGKLGSGLIVQIPEGFVTDLATIPKWGRWLFNPAAPDTAKASALHDYLLSIGWGQQAAAGEFFAAMLADDVPRIQRGIYYVAVVAAINRW